MKIGMFTSGYQRSNVEDIFRDARRFGYDYIELWGGRPHAFPYDLKAGDLSAILKLSEKYEMPVLGYTPEHNAYPYNYMIGSKAQQQDAIDYLKTAIEMGKALGAEFTLISAGHAGYEADAKEIRARLFASLRELTRHAQEVGQKLILEPLTPYESNVCTTANDLKEILFEIDSPYLEGMCDLVPPFVQQESIMGYFAKLGDRLKHFHIIDSDGSSDSHIMPGDGRIPLPEVLKEIREYGYDGTMTIELVTAYINEPSFYAGRAIERVREMLGDDADGK